MLKLHILENHLNTPRANDTFRPEQNGWYFANNIFNCILVSENDCFDLTLKFVDDSSPLIQLMACCRIGSKPLPEPMVIHISDTPCSLTIDYKWSLF